MEKLVALSESTGAAAGASAMVSMRIPGLLLPRGSIPGDVGRGPSGRRPKRPRTTGPHAPEGNLSPHQKKQRARAAMPFKALTPQEVAEERAAETVLPVVEVSSDDDTDEDNVTVRSMAKPAADPLHQASEPTDGKSPEAPQGEADVAEAEADGAQAEADGAQAETDVAQAEADGAQAEADGAQAEAV